MTFDLFLEGAEWNLPCLNDAVAVKTYNANPTGSTYYDSMTLQLTDVINTNDVSGADGFKMAVAVCVPEDRCAGSCDEQTISVAVDVSSDRIWVATFDFHVSQSIPTSEVCFTTLPQP